MMWRAWALALLAGLPAAAAGDPEGRVLLDDGTLRLGIHESAGAAVGWLSASGSAENALNTFDVGRYVQQSYYGDTDGSDWNGRPWRYNPVQGGSWKNEPSLLLESRLEAGRHYARVRPRHWATGELLEEVELEQWTELRDGAAHLRLRMTYRGAAAHKPRHQEMPAVFVAARFDTLVFCPEGSPAWQGAPLRRLQPGFPNEYAQTVEPWAAWVDGQGRGVGLFFPGTRELTCYRVREGHPRVDCSYFAPIQTWALAPGKVVEYKVALALGRVEEIRARFARLAAALRP